MNGKGTYPTLMQKHFNGADPCMDTLICVVSGLVHWFSSEEAAVLAVFLKGVCLAVAAQRPHDEHAASLGQGFCLFVVHREAQSLSVRQLGGHEGVLDLEGQQGPLPLGRSQPANLAPGQLLVPRSAQSKLNGCLFAAYATEASRWKPWNMGFCCGSYGRNGTSALALAAEIFHTRIEVGPSRPRSSWTSQPAFQFDLSGRGYGWKG